MNNYLLHITFLIIIFTTTISCKTKSYVVGKPGDSLSLIAVDNLENIFTVNENIVKKQFSKLIDNKIDSTVSYHSNSKGNIASIDVTNPMQIVVFYKDQQEIVLLDNNLAELGTISFDYKNNEIIDFICVSNRDNYFWTFSKDKQELKRIDKKLNISNKTQNIGQILDRDLNVIQMVEKNNLVYLLEENFGVFVFDLYGNYLKTIQLEGVKRIKITTKGILYKTKNKLIFFEFLSFDKSLLLIINQDIEDFEFSKKGVLGIYNHNVKIIYTNQLFKK